MINRRRENWLTPNKLSAVSCVVLLTAGCAAPARRLPISPGASGAPQVVSAREVSAEPKEALERPIPLVTLRGVTLGQAIESLGSQTGANLFVSWRVLEGAGVARDTPVNAQLAGVPLENVLDLLLADAGGGDGKLGYRVDGDVIRVSTTVDLDRSAHLRRERACRAADARAAGADRAGGRGEGRARPAGAGAVGKRRGAAAQRRLGRAGRTGREDGPAGQRDAARGDRRRGR